MMRCILLAIVFYAYLPTALSQRLKKADKIIVANLEREIQWLADDKMEGRRAGTPGEKRASDFIVAEFEKSNLKPKGDNGGWLQSFEIYDGRQINTAHLFINDKELQLNEDYFPFAFSASKMAEGTAAIALQEAGVPWFIDLKELTEAHQNNPHFNIMEAIHAQVKGCEKKGATAIIFFNSSKTAEDISFDPKDRSKIESLPVLYITKEAAKKYLKDESASMDIKIVVDIVKKTRTGHNVIGYIDNGDANTIVIGAHYDHLGYGEDGNTLYIGPGKPVFNGADDNASGTAAMIELARLLKQSKLKKANYLFIAFSGEELGLFGSKYFTEHPTVDLSRMSCMINMDMVGRLNDSSHALTIGGYGTSPAWGELLGHNPGKKNFSIRYDSSGTGPSDYTSFYRKNIPVLFFFTGLHSDYHKPTDDYDKINYKGELQIIKYISDLLTDLNGMGKLAFSKTREIQSVTAARFSVTLGIMPDYAFDGSGVRIDGISDGRPAQRAGLKTGDIIIKLGDYPVASLENYMQALSKFKKGDKTTVTYKRENRDEEAEVQFNQ